ncbi:MAG: RdgB/HAM1 family non-canonical purine NTP pyrophosphatase [Lachnospiraceae bacterium]|nr:RdgB/HAM1 family non-canonical purine NTP pyrophosphatase [Lachnospiraceae bacterium]
MFQIIFATGNEGKMREIRAILEDVKADILSMKEAGIRLDIEENGQSFAENAVIKARAVADALAAEERFQDCVVLADDSGLEIDCLNGEPGIHSARYLGEETPFDVKSRELLRRMEDVPDEERNARFVCAIAAVFPDGETITTRGTIEGRIGYALKGDNGFGYDPIFYLPEYRRTAAELSDEEKNRISHRSRALALMKEELKKRNIRENI